jgi:hypothetical protein
MGEYRNLQVRAAECERLAREATDKSIRAKLSELAAQFHELAERAKALEIFRQG